MLLFSGMRASWYYWDPIVCLELQAIAVDIKMKIFLCVCFSVI